jgi:hypothetical protein
MIVPTIGRKVWFTPANTDTEIAWGDKKQKLDATIIYVWSDVMVNLFVVDQEGKTWLKSSVPLLSGDISPNAFGYYAEWMPYQLGQAAKTEAVQAGVGQGVTGAPR